MHLTASHMYAFNSITRMHHKGMHFYRLRHVCIVKDRTCMHLTESHVYAFNRITHACI